MSKWIVRGIASSRRKILHFQGVLTDIDAEGDEEPPTPPPVGPEPEDPEPPVHTDFWYRSYAGA